MRWRGARRAKDEREGFELQSARDNSSERHVDSVPVNGHCFTRVGVANVLVWSHGPSVFLLRLQLQLQ